MRALVLPLVALLVLAALPVHAVPSQQARWTAWARSDGATGIAPMAAQGDVIVHCFGVSPGQDTCTLTNGGCGSWVPRFCAWIVGWDIVPPLDPVGLVGAFVGSTHVVMTGTYDPTAKVEGTCSWATAGFFSQAELPPPQCTWSSTNANLLAGTFTARFENRFYDARTVPFVGPALPDTSGLGPPVGSWHAALLANFAG